MDSWREAFKINVWFHGCKPACKCDCTNVNGWCNQCMISILCSMTSLNVSVTKTHLQGIWTNDLHTTKTRQDVISRITVANIWEQSAILPCFGHSLFFCQISMLVHVAILLHRWMKILRLPIASQSGYHKTMKTRAAEQIPCMCTVSASLRTEKISASIYLLMMFYYNHCQFCVLP